jgi:hypothetical protein
LDLHDEPQRVGSLITGGYGFQEEEAKLMYTFITMLNNRPRVVVKLALVCTLLSLCGCQHRFSITAPAPPPIDPSEYTSTDYQADVTAYKTATTPGAGLNPDLAKQARNNIAYGLMGQIDVVYGAYYNQLFSTKNTVAIGSDALTLGLSSAATIATHAATKTILSALGTGFSGLALSVDKNYFAQQTFPVIGVAMQTRRDKIRATIISNLALDTTTYPLLATRRDLVAYLNAGTLASGLQELQEEAGAATAATVPTAAGAKGPPAPSSLTAAAGNSQVSLSWTAAAGATSYNLYWATSPGVTPANGTKINVAATNSYVHSGLKNDTAYYYVVTAVNASGESAASAQTSATPAAPAPAAAPAVPSGLTATAGNAQVSLSWTAAAGATSYNLYWATSPSVTPLNGTEISGIATNSYTHSGPGVTNGNTYYYVVTAVNASGKSAASAQASATPTAPVRAEQILKLTPH